MMMTMPPDTASNLPANVGRPEPDDKPVLPVQRQEDTVAEIGQAIAAWLPRA
jgi:hypothetical protein